MVYALNNCLYLWYVKLQVSTWKKWRRFPEKYIKTSFSRICRLSLNTHIDPDCYEKLHSHIDPDCYEKLHTHIDLDCYYNLHKSLELGLLRSFAMFWHLVLLYWRKLKFLNEPFFFWYCFLSKTQGDPNQYSLQIILIYSKMCFGA